MEVIAFLSLLIPLILTIVKEFLSAKARARERGEKHKIDLKGFLEMVDRSLVKLREEAREENRDIQNTEDRMDEEGRK